jgi:hypothetical protein
VHLRRAHLATVPVLGALLTATCAHALGQPPQLLVVSSAPGVVVKWNTGSGIPGAVYVSESGAPERLFARGPRGSQSAPWVLPERRYRFRLYGEVRAKQLLITVTIGKKAVTKRPPSVPDLNPPRTGHIVNAILAYVPYLVLATFTALLVWHMAERRRASRG